MNFKVLSGHSFADISDYIFSTYNKDKNGIFKSLFFPLNTNILEDNDIIYCKTDHIYDLFENIKYVDRNLKLITSESDHKIDKNIFDSRPNCIKKWYGININYNHENLIPIPLGISNNNCNKTLKFENILNTDQKKEKLLYINHRVETNFSKRKWIYEKFNNNNWCTVNYPNLTLEEFQVMLNKHSYMLCPEGNGPDTHRLWECLYSGIIPVVENHITNKNIKDLPILFVNSFEEVNEKLLENNLNILKNNSKEKLNIYWWKKFIKEG